jgi:hypothetical protein
LSDPAYRQVVAALQTAAVDRQVEGHAMVVRPLGFQAGADSRTDYVLNMFVIGPQELGRGPHILPTCFGRTNARVCLVGRFVERHSGG